MFPSEKERGWYDVAWSGRAAGIPLEGTLRVFPWHGETFNLPRGAIVLCSGVRVRNQAFLNRPAIGVPFHIEANQGIIDRWIFGLEPLLRAAIETEPASSHEGNRKICGTMLEPFLTGGYCET